MSGYTLADSNRRPAMRAPVVAFGQWQGTMIELGELLRRWRDRAMLTQEELAERTGLSVRTIRRLESGHQHRPRATSLESLVRVLGLSGAERSLLLAVAPAEPLPGDVGVPAQLPSAPAVFVGRNEELDHLDALVDGGQVTVIAGSAGVGKTALALHWAHRRLARFPDGQLFANLRGFDPASTPATPLDILSRFLRSLGADSGSLPRDADEASALFRTLLFKRQVLVLLDNARDVNQIRHLLPAAAGGHVLVTSRKRLGGLIANDNARLLTLEPLAPAAAEDLLLEVGGREATARSTVALLARRCAYLPLALRVAGANLTCRPHLTMADLVDQFDRTGALTALRIDDDEQSTVTTAFDVSYAGLTPSARQVFLRSSLIPGHDFEIHTAAAITGFTIAKTREAVDQLSAAHIMSQDSVGRFCTHDLLRAYARSRLAEELDLDTVTETERRLVDFFLDAAHAASYVHPRRNRDGWDCVHRPSEPLRFGNRQDALTWFDQEIDNLMGVFKVASSRGWHDCVWRLTEMLYPLFNVRRLWPQWREANQIGLDSARAAGDAEGVIRMHLCQGVVHKQVGNYPQARRHWAQALQVAQHDGYRRLAAAARVNLGGLCINEGDPAQGAMHLELALAEKDYSSIPGNNFPLNINYGCALIDLNRLDEASGVFHEVLKNSATVVDPQNTCMAHHNLAEIALRRDDPATALRHGQHELELALHFGDPLRQATAHDILGSATCRNDHHQARQHWNQALAVYERLRHRRAEPLADWLRRFEHLDADEIAQADHARRLISRRMI